LRGGDEVVTKLDSGITEEMHDYSRVSSEDWRLRILLRP